LLFVPVSGPFGKGEYARSLAIASACQKRLGAKIHFILSREAPYAKEVPFEATLLPSSATFHSQAVIEVIQSFRPDVAVFDNAGRTRQLAAARRAGANLIFISARARQRRKAFRLRWMRLIDEHWIAYPQFLAGELSALERLKLKWLARPTVRYLDVIMARQTDSPCAGGEVLFIPGGGTAHPGAQDAVAKFVAAAEQLAARGIATVMIGAKSAKALPNLTCHASLPQAQLVTLMRGARLIVANGGSTLLQGIASGAACIGVPIAGDQDERIARCVAAGVSERAALSSEAMAQKALALLEDPVAQAALKARAASLDLADGVEVAVAAVEGLWRTRSS
jgi:hypothetical protein